MILGKIDLSKVNKEFLYKTDKGNYLDVVIIETPNSKYGDFMIKQGLPKEQREAGVESAILGNAKNFGKTPSLPKDNAEDDLPFILTIPIMFGMLSPFLF